MIDDDPVMDDLMKTNARLLKKEAECDRLREVAAAAEQFITDGERRLNEYRTHPDVSAKPLSPGWMRLRDAVRALNADSATEEP